MPRSLAAIIHEGSRDVAGRPSKSPDPVDLPSPVGARHLGPLERDEIFREAVSAYRRGPQGIWGAVVLELLAPEITAQIRRLLPPGAGEDAEDVRQEFMLEVLQAAGRLPLYDASDYLRVRVIKRARKYVGRWLRHQARHYDWREELSEDLTNADRVDIAERRQVDKQKS